MEKTAKLYELPLDEARTYLFAAAFIAGNLLLPQLAHTIPGGGLIFLPIYFFTLIAAYKYGFRVGLLTALFSPVINHMLFGMPPLAVLPAIMVKSVLLAAGAAYMARKEGRVTLLGILVAILFYQIAGSLIEWGITGSWQAALQDMRIGLPGIALQLAGGFLVLKAIEKY